MNDIAITPQHSPMPVAVRQELTIEEIRRRKQLVHQLMGELMKPGTHYGVIPGTDGKPALLKSGAEMLCMTFQLRPTFTTRQIDLPNNHREYQVTCQLVAADGTPVANGLGSASTMETKHRWRIASLSCPVCAQPAVRRGRDGFYCGSKFGGCGENFGKNDKRLAGQKPAKIENPDVADQWNTVLKMAAKRAHTHAVLNATACSDMFVPEDDEDVDSDEPPPKEEAPKLTRKQELLRDCVKLATELQKAQRSKSDLATLMASVGVTAPAKWSDLSEDDLSKLIVAFADDLKLAGGK
jgi:hypothetical protein